MRVLVLGSGADAALASRILSLAGHAVAWHAPAARQPRPLLAGPVLVRLLAAAALTEAVPVTEVNSVSTATDGAARTRVVLNTPLYSVAQHDLVQAAKTAASGSLCVLDVADEDGAPLQLLDVSRDDIVQFGVMDAHTGDVKRVDFEFRVDLLLNFDPAAIPLLVRAYAKRHAVYLRHHAVVLHAGVAPARSAVAIDVSVLQRGTGGELMLLPVPGDRIGWIGVLPTSRAHDLVVEQVFPSLAQLVDLSSADVSNGVREIASVQLTRRQIGRAICLGDASRGLAVPPVFRDNAALLDLSCWLDALAESGGNLTAATQQTDALRSAHDDRLTRRTQRWIHDIVHAGRLQRWVNQAVVRPAVQQAQRAVHTRTPRQHLLWFMGISAAAVQPLPLPPLHLVWGPGMRNEQLAVRDAAAASDAASSRALVMRDPERGLVLVLPDNVGAAASWAASRAVKRIKHLLDVIKANLDDRAVM